MKGQNYQKLSELLQQLQGPSIFDEDDSAAGPDNTQLAPVGSVGLGANGGNVHSQIQNIDADGQNARAFSAAGGVQGPDSDPATAAPTANPEALVYEGAAPTEEESISPQNPMTALQQLLEGAQSGLVLGRGPTPGSNSPLQSALTLLAGSRNKRQGRFDAARLGVDNARFGAGAAGLGQGAGGFFG